MSLSAQSKIRGEYKKVAGGQYQQAGVAREKEKPCPATERRQDT